MQDTETTRGLDAPTDSSTGNNYDAETFTRFQIDLLAVLDAEARHGLGVKDVLEAHYDDDVNHGRLYPNLDDLVERGLVSKRALDDRTNEYALTDAGVAVLDARRDWLGGGA
jgi:DNA-binding PadR family transcriptional regulator